MQRHVGRQFRFPAFSFPRIKAELNWRCSFSTHRELVSTVAPDRPRASYHPAVLILPSPIPPLKYWIAIFPQSFMPLRVCPYCDSSFSKIEHLKRHERSRNPSLQRRPAISTLTVTCGLDTGEKPYQCHICHKRYARGDVLKRHIKGHSTQQVHENFQNVRDEDSIHVASNPSPPRQSEIGASIESPARSPCTPPQPERPDRDNQTLVPTSPISRPARASSEPATRAHSRRHTAAQAEVCVEPAVDAPPAPGALPTLSPPRSDFHDSQSDVQDMAGTQLEPNAGGVDMERAAQSRTPQIAFPAAQQNLNGDPLGYYLDDFSMINFSRSPNNIPLDCRGDQRSPERDGLAWLSAFNGELPSPSGMSNIWDMLHTPGDSFLMDDLRGSVSSKHSLGSDIPEERFVKVARLWPRKREPPWYLIQTLWSDAVHHGASNLFAEYSPDDTNDNSPSLRTNGPRRGLGDVRRLELLKEFAFMRNRTNHDDDNLSDLTYDSRLPSADTLAMCINLYFQRFHIIVPFIHEPTFSARRTPNALLFPMCLIGLHLLDPDRTRRFVAAQLLKGIERCNAVLSRPWKRTDSRTLITLLGAAILYLSYAFILEECAQSEQTYSLYVKTMTLAQQNGLFEVGKGPPVSSVLPQNRRDDLAWKAWARVESAKRVTACLVIVDSFFTSSIGSNPALRVDTMQLYMPCSARLFNAANADHWTKLDVSGVSYVNPAVIDIQGYMKVFPAVKPTSSMAIYTLLSVAWLNMANVRNRVLTQGDGTLKNVLFPGEYFQVDTAGTGIAPLLQTIYTYYGREFLDNDPNSMALWHTMCMSLTANLNLFEIAAGREGGDAGKAALQKILQWADSPYARRACLHAAQVHACMMRRRIADGTMFMSEVAVFHAALVLGLYVYASPPSLEQGDDQPLELLDDIDWTQVADEGLPGWVTSHHNSEYPPNKFISEGGSISFNGVVFSGGYSSARRMLMHYAGLLEEVGRWNWRKFRHILHVMSDSMVELA
ncbi:C2H2 type zinc finger domain-containing [Fusarium albosuccineum]|uniref:C2H2 type zinc finger domain-containing n=1 Tax=Fusarium albosuccineum TaxID=1237068 RepID=A0A8H4PBV1_9HYPO|nr:C2H2 type zinc finger domain-containing [Fusarium albosuccineum]